MFIRRATRKYLYVHKALIDICPLEMEVPRPEPLLANSAANAVEAVWLGSKLKDLQPPVT
jgi:hypothetical protein